MRTSRRGLGAFSMSLWHLALTGPMTHLFTSFGPRSTFHLLDLDLEAALGVARLRKLASALQLDHFLATLFPGPASASATSCSSNTSSGSTDWSTWCSAKNCSISAIVASASSQSGGDSSSSTTATAVVVRFFPTISLGPHCLANFLPFEDPQGAR